MITKTFINSRKKWKVSFTVPEKELPEDIKVEQLSLVGSFNNWDNSASPMKYIKRSKTWKTNVYLPPESKAQFRYIINRQQWLNDLHADGYVPNAMGSENCVVNLPQMPEQN